MTIRPLVSSSGKSKTIRPVRPNAGVASLYQKRLDALIAEMANSLSYWLTAAYRANEPATSASLMASDASAAATLNVVMKRLARRWMRRFDELAGDMAKWFATTAAQRADGSLKAALAKGGMSVKFTMTRAQNDAIQATIAENVELIKSIGQQHLASVQGAVMRSVSAGRDLHSLAKDLEHTHGVTKRRAAFIALDQNNKATAVITRARQQELGITQAQWLHSAGGKKPRPSHVKAGKDKLIYDVSKGAFIDGEWIYPGQLPRCRCVSKSVIPGFD